MSQIIKNILREAFIRQLNLHSLDQITVTDLVKQCGVSRRTFYHYYQDIYQMIEELFLDETKKTMEVELEQAGWEEGFLQMIKFSSQNKNAILHIYHSNGREYLERYLYHVAKKAITYRISMDMKDQTISEEDQNLLIAFYTSAIVSLSLEWIAHGMEKNAKELIQHLMRILNGTLKTALSNCAKN